MRDRQRAESVDGWLIIDKPAGMTSMAVTSRVRRWTGARKAGHAGTLDPLADGVLPIALGEATKTISRVVDGSKEYRFTLVWGAFTDTDDRAGRVIQTSQARPSSRALRAALRDFCGDIEQRPPDYCARKIDGRRAYHLAREAHKPELASRRVRVDDWRIDDWREGHSVVLTCRCGKGVYVRSLARDLARALGTCGHVGALRRLRVEPFGEDRAMGLARFEERVKKKNWRERLLPLSIALNGLPVWRVHERQASALRCGRFLTGPKGRAGSGEASEILAVTMDGSPVAIAGWRADGIVRPIRVFAEG